MAPTPTHHLHTLVPEIYGIVATSGVLMVAIVTARIYTRLWIQKKHFGIDDWTMLVASVLATALFSLTCAMPIWGGGRHTADFPSGWMTNYRKMIYASELISPSSLALTKISACLTYLKIFVSRVDHYFCYIVIAILIIWDLSTTFQAIFYCSPIKAFWDYSVKEYKCIDYYVSLMILMSLNSAMDILVFLWPAKSILTLQLPKAQKISLIAAFGFGCLVSIVGVVRCVYLHIYLKDGDAYLGSIVLILNALEVNLAVFCGSIPSLRSLLIYYIPRMNISTRSHSRSTSNGKGFSRSKKTAGSHSFPFRALEDDNELKSSKTVNTTFTSTISAGIHEDERNNLSHMRPGGEIRLTREVEVCTGEYRDRNVSDDLPIELPDRRELTRGDGDSDEMIFGLERTG